MSRRVILPIDRGQLNIMIRQAGFANYRDFAKAIGLDAVIMSNIVKGKRSVGLGEACRMAIALRSDLESVARVFGFLPAAP